MNTLVFDIETVPDVVSGRKLFGLDALGDDDAALAMAALRRQRTGSEFLPHHLHRIVAISIALRTADSFRIWSLGSEDAPEAEILRRFFDGIERFNPVLVSWNGGGFDLPVIHYRALLHGIAAARYWETGDGDTSFRYNNYLNRFHWRHVDLMDTLAAYQPRAFAPLDQIATMLGWPGKQGMRGDQVWERFKAGEIAAIRDYCETDVLNTYLIYQRFELMRGQLDEAQYQAECQYVRDTLKEQDQPHLRRFLEAWAKNST